LFGRIEARSSHANAFFATTSATPQPNGDALAKRSGGMA
jgi:hypothetical protein